ncbi:hypothetical protein PT974_04301 [Cladobotryum mycophilum]|uniref:Proteasome assembly chaperone 3 n=1 Tax=Cladobotryum mycophilum TaxID=491253 RepID=A0ABR0SUT2_9HYPO
MSFRETEVVEVSIPLPRSLDARIFIRLTIQAKAILLFLTTASQDELGNPNTMGSFVYALPDRFNPQQPLATTLFSSEQSLEFTTRIARLLARKSKFPVYVTNSISLESTGMGGTVEEEMEAFKSVVEVVVGKLESAGFGSAAANGL